MSKPFNLERALAGDPVVTRDDQILLKVLDANLEIKQPVIGVFSDGEVRTYHKDGRFYSSGKEESSLDLVMAPKKRTVWVNLHSSGYYFKEYESEKDAKQDVNTSFKYLAIAVPVEIED